MISIKHKKLSYLIKRAYRHGNKKSRKTATMMSATLYGNERKKFVLFLRDEKKNLKSLKYFREKTPKYFDFLCRQKSLS